MNNKRIFSVHFFWQSFKQLKAIGIICSIILAVISLLPIISHVVTQERLAKMYETYTIETELISGWDCCASLAITFVVFAPLLALNAWKFLNKRSTSDFYLSLPYKRICLFFSRLASVIAWLFLMYAISLIGRIAGYLIFSKYYVVDYGVIFQVHGSMFICCMLVTAAITLACSVTGNMITNVCVSGLILFLPRILIAVISETIAESVYVVEASKVIPLFGGTSNIVTGMVFSVFDYGSGRLIQDMILSLMPNLYTLILALVYFGLATVLFVSRKSECAGKAAIGKVSRFIIRTVGSFSITSIGLIPIFGNLNAYEDVGSLIIYIISVFLVAAVVLAIYEVAQSKNIRSVVACIPAMIISFILTLIIGGCVNIAAERILQYRPQPSKVSYVTIQSGRYSYYGNSNKDYFESVTQNIKIQDKKIISLLCDEIEKNARIVQNSEEDELLYSDQYLQFFVYLKDGSMGHSRKVYLSQQSVQELNQNIVHVDSYREAYFNLPPADAVIISTSIKNGTKEQNVKTYETLLEEIKTISFSDWYANLSMEGYGAGKYISIRFARSGKTYIANIPVTTLIPKTMNTLMQEENLTAKSDTATWKKMLEYLRKPTDDTKDDSEALNIAFYAQENKDEQCLYSFNHYLSENPQKGKEVVNKIIAAVEKGDTAQSFATAKSYISLNYYCREKTEDGKGSGIRHKTITYNLILDGYDRLEDYGLMSAIEE